MWSMGLPPGALVLPRPLRINPPPSALSLSVLLGISCPAAAYPFAGTYAAAFDAPPTAYIPRHNMPMRTRLAGEVVLESKRLGGFAINDLLFGHAASSSGLSSGP